MTTEQKNIDRVETIAEELKIFTGWDVRVAGRNLIELDTIAGRMKYNPSEATVMGDVYRFISNYGIKIHSWGLDKKIEEKEIVFKKRVKQKN